MIYPADSFQLVSLVRAAESCTLAGAGLRSKMQVMEQSLDHARLRLPQELSNPLRRRRGALEK